MSKTCQLFSGSSGNAIFIASRNTRILVDAGVSAKRLEQAMYAIGEDAAALDAIFVTHEHGDHIQGLRVLASRYHIPVFAHEAVLEALRQGGHLTDKFTACIAKSGMELDGIEVQPFALSHDSAACNGYRFQLPNGRSIGVCTDTGYVTEDAKNTLAGTDLVYLESNHEVTMLQNSGYPYPLKKRILSNQGHLSNEASSLFATALVESGTTRLVLAHLSRENNTPAIAEQTALAGLSRAGLRENTDFQLRVSAPINDTKAIVL